MLKRCLATYENLNMSINSKYINKDDWNAVKAARLFVGLYVLFTFISYLFTLFTHYYNGDFLMQKCDLDFPLLTLNFILTIIPYFFIYYLYKYFKTKYHSKHYIPESGKIIENITIILNVIYLFLVWKYSIGKAFADVYSAPPIITLFIQILLRFSPNTWLGFSFFISKSKKKCILFAIFLIFNAILTGYFGVFLALIFMTILKYNSYWIPFIKKHYIALILIIFASSPIIEFGYDLRDTIRGTESNASNLDGTTLLIGKFFGRLSPLSNTSMILQREKVYKIEAEKLPTTFFVNSMLCVIYSGFKEEYPPEKILSGSKAEDYVSFMCGTTGILYFAAYKSWLSFCITLFLIVLMDILIFKVLSLFKFKLKYEVGLCLLMQPTMSGVGKEYFSILWAFCIIFLICATMHTITKKRIKTTHV